MPEAVLTPDQKSQVRQAIRNRWDKDSATYEDGNVAAVLSIQMATAGTIISCRQVEALRHEMGLVLPSKPAKNQIPKEQVSTKTAEPKPEKEQSMRTSFTDEEKEKIRITVAEHTGGDNSMTAAELCDYINKSKLVSSKVGLHVINNCRRDMKKAGVKTARKGLRAKSEAQAAASVSKSSSVDFLKGAIELLTLKRDAYTTAIAALQECLNQEQI